MARKPLPQTPNRLDAIDGARPLDEKLLSMIVSLASEVSILRARLDSCERLLVETGALREGAIDMYDPDPVAATERDAQRQAIIRKVFRPLTEGEASEPAEKEG